MSACPRCGAALKSPGAACPVCDVAAFLEIEPAAAPAAAPAAVQAPSPAAAPRGRRAEKPPEPGTPGWRKVLGHPAAAFAIGLAAFPLSKALFLPNYVFNFLTTLVHEIGHCAFAWLMGMPSIPGVSILGGGITVWQEQKLPICLAWLAAIGWLGWRFRERRAALAAAVAGGVAYLLLAFTSAREFLPVAGGVLFEVGGAAACFYVATGPSLRREFERPLYALWGWWMLLNRGAETVLMLRDRAYWNASTVYESGLAAGLTNDLEVIRDRLGTAPEPMLKVVLLLCVLALPAALAARVLARRLSEAE